MKLLFSLSLFFLRDPGCGGWVIDTRHGTKGMLRLGTTVDPAALATRIASYEPARSNASQGDGRRPRKNKTISGRVGGVGGVLAPRLARVGYLGAGAPSAGLGILQALRLLERCEGAADVQDLLNATSAFARARQSVEVDVRAQYDGDTLGALLGVAERLQKGGMVAVATLQAMPSVLVDIDGTLIDRLSSAEDVPSDGGDVTLTVYALWLAASVSRLISSGIPIHWMEVHSNPDRATNGIAFVSPRRYNDLTVLARHLLGSGLFGTGAARVKLMGPGVDVWGEPHSSIPPNDADGSWTEKGEGQRARRRDLIGRPRPIEVS